MFYRAVSAAELSDLRRTGGLRPGVNSCEGMHLAMNLADALRWGDALFGEAGFAVVRVTVDDGVAAALYRWDMLDGIGPAGFATIEQLAGAEVVEVSDE